MNGKLILLVEDEKHVQDYNGHLLSEEGFSIETAMTLADAKKALAASRPDAVILDIGMPDGNGLDFLRELRDKGSRIPVLLLTGYGNDAEVESGFDAGCDDYLPKPYTFGVLLRRLNRLLQSAEQAPETISKGNILLETYSNKVYVDGVDLGLTNREFDVLFLLVQNEDKVLKAEYIYETIWKMPLAGDKNAIQTIFSRLRRKIEPSGYDIEVLRGKGYVFTKI